MDQLFEWPGAEEPPKKRPPSSKRARGEQFFAKENAAGVFKHGVLRRVATPFASKAGFRSPNGRVALLDGYAGPGYYDDGAPGSPALLAEAAEWLEKTRNVECIFVENDKSMHARLEENFAAHPRCSVMPRGRIEDRLDDVLARATGMPLLAFLDPYGLGLSHEALTTKILARSQMTDVLLNFSAEAIRRCGRYIATQSSKRQRTMINTFSRVLGGTWWQAILEEDPDSDALLTQVMDGYARTISALGWKVAWVPVSRSLGGKPTYYLVYITRHRHGLWVFHEAVARTNLELDNQQHGAQSPLFGGVAERGAVIRSNLERMLREKGPFVVGDHISDVYGDAVALACEPDVRSAIKSLYAEGKTATDGVGKIVDMVVTPPQPPTESQPPASRPKSGHQALAHRPLASDPPTA